MVSSNGRMPGDRWVLASAMQKAIRRGELERATNAGHALWLVDRRYFWQRLLVTTMEDVSVGDTDALVTALKGIASLQWRKELGDAEAGLHLIRLLCCATKSRLIDSIYIQSSVSLAYQEARIVMAADDTSALKCKSSDEAVSIVERAIAIWLLAGTKRYPSDHMPHRTGDLEEAITVLRSLPIPASLADACIGVTRRLSYPLPLHIPLVWQEVQRHVTTVRHHVIPRAPDVDGLPVYAADGFTRVGRACFRELQKVTPDLQPFTAQQMALGVFYIDGELVASELTSPALAAIQNAGERADIESTGLSLSAYAELRHILHEQFGRLTDIRLKRLKQHLRSEGKL